MASGKRHSNEAALIAFCRTQEAPYIRRTAEWLKENYPGSVPAVLPQLRKIYAEKIPPKVFTK